MDAEDGGTGATPPPGGGTARVLVVDGDDGVRRVAGRMLASRGHTVAVAEHGDHARALLEGGLQVDLLLVDVRMAGLSGPALSDWLAAARPGVPVVLMTGSVDGPAAWDGAAGSPSVLRKPFTGAELDRAVRAALAAAREAHAAPDGRATG